MAHTVRLQVGAGRKRRGEVADEIFNNKKKKEKEKMSKEIRLNGISRQKHYKKRGQLQEMKQKNEQE